MKHKINGMSNNGVTENSGIYQKKNNKLLPDINKTVLATLDIKHTDDVHEIMTKVPAWILRWGITVFFAILLMILSMSLFLYYPDTISAILKIESADIAEKSFAPFSGRIISLFVKMGAVVKKGQPLMKIESFENPIRVYTFYAQKTGRVSFTSLLEAGCSLDAGQEVFVIHGSNEQIYGLMPISVEDITKIKLGQRVLIYLNGSGPSGYEHLTGSITYVSDEPINGQFIAKVSFPIYDRDNNHLVLKDWMSANAKIIIRNTTLFTRILNNEKLSAE